MSLDCQFVVAPSVFSNVHVYGDMILKRPINFRLCYEIDRGGSEDQKELWVEWLLHRSDVTSKGWNLHGQVSFNFLRSLLTLRNLLNLKGVLVMVFNATFNNISGISCRSVFLVGKPEYPEKTTDKLYHTMLYRVHLTWSEFELTTLVAIGTDCIGSCKSNYRMITITTAPSNGQG